MLYALVALVALVRIMYIIRTLGIIDRRQSIGETQRTMT